MRAYAPHTDIINRRGSCTPPGQHTHKHHTLRHTRAPPGTGSTCRRSKRTFAATTPGRVRSAPCTFVPHPFMRPHTQQQFLPNVHSSPHLLQPRNTTLPASDASAHHDMPVTLICNTRRSALPTTVARTVAVNRDAGGAARTWVEGRGELRPAWGGAHARAAPAAHTASTRLPSGTPVATATTADAARLVSHNRTNVHAVARAPGAAHRMRMTLSPTPRLPRPAAPPAALSRTYPGCTHSPEH
jgi:hypothetical protein